MLILARKKGSKIVINNDITITFFGPFEEDGSLYKIGIEAPKHIPVDREEIHQKKMREQLDKKRKRTTRARTGA